MSTSGEHGYPDTGHTRTHLPGGDPYGGAPRRTPRSSSRSLITVVGVVVLLIAAIAFANRDNPPPTAESPKGAPNQNGAPTAASGETPATTRQNGIPTNFPHTKQGAESAAANYAVTLVSADILKPARRREIVRTVFVADQQAALTDKFDKAYSKQFLSNIGLDQNGNSAAGHTYVSRTAPLGTKATSYSASAATIEVWCTGVFGTAREDSTNPVTTDWFTLTLQLRWENDDWKAASFSQKDGPTPIPGDGKASSADQMAKAVEEYGGFSYAR
ncbi:hypothetical protein ACWEIK_02910 [Streptomyces sp. NPDC004673]